MKKIFSAMNDKLANILLIDAQEVAKRTHHKLIEPVDILIALLQDPESQGTLKLARFFPQGVSGVVKMANALLKETAQDAQKKESQSSKKNKSEKIPEEMKEMIEEHFPLPEESSFYLSLSSKSKKLIEKAYLDSKKRGDNYLGTSHIFMVCIASKDLHDKLSSKIFLTNWREHLIDPPKSRRLDDFMEVENKSSLGNFVTNISEQAKSGKLDPVLGRDKEMNTLISYLGRKKKNNVLLLGEPGVGKTALIEGLAQRLIKSEMPSWISEKRILTLDVAGLVAGTRYRGDFEERFKIVMREIERDPATIIFIDEIHMIMGAGSGESGNIDIANMLKPLLARTGVQFIGATTLSEYKIHMERDKALTRRFQILSLDEPSAEECLYILKNLLPTYEKFHGLRYTEGALELAISLSQTYLKSKKLPDKAIDILDIASAQKKMQNHKGHTVREEDIQKTLGIILQTSPYLESHNLLGARERFKSLKKSLNQKVLGQEELMGWLTQKLTHSTLMGTNKGKRPFLSSVLAGEHGVGKTYLPRVLADLLWKPATDQHITFNMADFNESSALFKLVGTPIGHAGHREGGILTETAKNYPSAVLVFENIDLAHASVIRALTTILKTGEISDNKGQVVSFGFNLLFFTLTVKAKGKGSAIGFGDEKIDPSNKEALKKDWGKYLPADFLGNVDILGLLTPLVARNTQELISEKVSAIKKELTLQGVTLEIKDKTASYLTENWETRKGEFSSLDNFLYKVFEEPLVDAILKNSGQSPLKIMVRVSQNSLKFDIIA